jgi:DNA-binding CsgD family transcriptional regulator
MAQLSVKADRRQPPVGFEVSPASLAMQVKGLGRIAASRTVILNHTASDVAVQIAADTTGYFDWPSGTLTAPAYGGLPITVTFEGGDAPGSYRTSVRIAAGQGAEFAVPVIVAVAPSSATLITRETNRTAGGLTVRELEIMLLVAQGNTSRQIGQALFISPRTVEMHVEGSLLKLGCRTRAEAVGRLAELGTLSAEAIGGTARARSVRG